jgi:hypothetical protein
MPHKDITVRKIYSSRVIIAGDTHDSDIELLSTGKTGIIDLGDFAQVGSFSVWIKVVGDGSLELSYLLSHDRINWVTPTGAGPIVSGFTSSDGSSGEDLIVFRPEFSRFIKFRAKEISTTDPITFTMLFAVQ